jgi:DNA-binding response OmpR family regulator
MSAQGDPLMADWDLSDVDAVVVDSQLHVARVVREMLLRLGIKKTEIFDASGSVSSHLDGVAADLVLIDCDKDQEAEGLHLVRAIRKSDTVLNPYAGLIATTWQPTQNLLVRATNAGVDLLLAKPFSPRLIQTQIAALIENRRKFVVTSDFVGPDRRKQPREGTQVPLIEVPNTLRLKALGVYNAAQARQAIAAARALVNDGKRIRTAIQAGFLVEFAAIGLVDEPPSHAALEHLLRVPAVLDEVERRCPAGTATGITVPARELRRLVEQVRADVMRGPVAQPTLAQLKALAARIMHAVDPERSPAMIDHEVRTAVAAYMVRIEALLQAKMVANQTAP